MNFKNEIIIDCDREKVWRLFNNAENLKRWQKSLISYEHQTGEPGQVGSQAKLVYEEMGNEIALVQTITDRQEFERISSLFESQYATNNMRNQFIKINEKQTRWIAESEVVLNGFAKMFGSVLAEAFSKRLQDQMTQFKAMAESEA